MYCLGDHTDMTKKDDDDLLVTLHNSFRASMALGRRLLARGAQLHQGASLLLRVRGVGSGRWTKVSAAAAMERGLEFLEAAGQDSWDAALDDWDLAMTKVAAAMEIVNQSLSSPPDSASDGTV
eukprot:Polyplicarium_translucidae@DN1108_c0_g1_i1.p1